MELLIYQRIKVMIEINKIKLFDTQELSSLLNLSECSVANLRKKGLLRYTRIGRKLYSSEEALMDYLNGVENKEALHTDRRVKK